MVAIEEKVAKTYKDGNKSIVIFYKIKFNDRVGFFMNSLSRLVDNHREKMCKVQCKDCSCFL